MPFSEPISEESALERLREGAVLVTVNQRLSRFFLQAYARRQQDLGNSVFVTPRILPYSAWVRELSDAAQSPGDEPEAVPLSLLQELMLWEEVLGQSELADRLLRIPPAAQSVMRAWALCCSWRIPWRDLDAFEEDGDTRAFTAWARKFAAECEAGGWLDPSRIPDRVIRCLREGLLEPPRELILCGFDEHTPQQTDLFQALEEAGCPVRSTQTADRAGDVTVAGYADRTEEITAAAVWARERLERDPHQRIGVVAPDLSAIKEMTERIFRDVFSPGDMEDEPRQQLFNISAGRALADYPLVGAGLTILDLVRGPLDWQEASGLILSPFLAGAESELTARSRLDAELRKRRETDTDLDDLVAACQGDPLPCPLLLERLQALSALAKALPRHQSPAEWAASLQELVEAAGWPGEASLNSAEFQCRSAWVEALGDLASLGSITSSISFPRALALFRRILQERPFQPEQGEAPVQILGVLEASGIGLDRLWVMGLDEASWPTPARPNPFLPLQLQRRYGVPRCSPERELDFCRRVTRRLLTSADRVRLSFPRMDGDTELLPSPLLPQADSRQQERSAANPKLLHFLDCLRCAETEHLTDRTSPGLEEGSYAPGGTALLRDQALCPFRAFAAHRLGAEQIEDPEIGLDPAARGRMVHTALHRLWNELGDRESLLAKSEQELHALAHKTAERAVERMRGNLPGPFSRRFAALEVDRLRELLLEWLELEKERSPFGVRSCEHRQHIHLSGLWLRTVADRIDHLPHGGVAVIDYKTGDLNVGEWFRERPGEPQIPLYCLASGDSVLAASVARVKTGRCRFQGVTAPEARLPGTRTVPHADGEPEPGTWEGLLADWGERLRGLAREVRDGYAPAAPRDGETTCRDCGMATLCRIREHLALTPQDKEADAE